MELTTADKTNNPQPSVVYDVKDTKFEWNSQLLFVYVSLYSRLFMMSKIQNLNGTHNLTGGLIGGAAVVYDVKDTKIVSNS